MDFDVVLAQGRELLQRQGQASYRALKLRFQLDDEALAALTDELIYAERVAVDEDGRVLVWTGDPTLASATPSVSTAPPAQVPSRIRRRTSLRRSSPPAPPWKGNASRSPSCLPI